jgi:hypothetical protein
MQVHPADYARYKGVLLGQPRATKRLCRRLCGLNQNDTPNAVDGRDFLQLGQRESPSQRTYAAAHPDFVTPVPRVDV